MTTPEVVIACAWYNRAEYIRSTVDSLLSQEFDSFEIVIVNDGSPDPRVREILDSYSDPRLRVIHQENTGFVGAIRRAISASQAPLIAVQGSGEVSLPWRLRNQYDFLKRHPDHVAISSRAQNVLVKGDGTEGEKGVTTSIPKVDLELLLRDNPMVHGASMYRRAAYNAVGGYRVMFQFAQDLDLWLRLQTKGKIAVIETLDVKRFIFEKDGVGNDPNKLAVQTRLAFLARKAAHEVSRCGIDPIEVYGPSSMLFLQADKAVSKRTAACYLKLLMLNPDGVSDFLARQAWRDDRNLRSFIVRVIAAVRPLRRLSAGILRRRMKAAG